MGASKRIAEYESKIENNVKTQNSFYPFGNVWLSVHGASALFTKQIAQDPITITHPILSVIS
jgi:FlaA1/EpsC-like NDP-sugar epimerase